MFSASLTCGPMVYGQQDHGPMLVRTTVQRRPQSHDKVVQTERDKK